MSLEKFDPSIGNLPQEQNDVRWAGQEGALQHFHFPVGVTTPLMSFVLVNWNYARYVGQTIDSIRAQDYENFECVVVDNGSDDDSLAVIDRHVGADPRFRIIRLPENLGQLGAAFIGIRETSGPFLAMIDSDDVLFPSYASAHIQVHLALPASVGLTTSNVMEINGAGECLSSGMRPLAAKGQGTVPGLKDESSVARLASVSSGFYNSILSVRTLTVPPDVAGWSWFPGTSNVFRRSIIEFFMKAGNEPYMRPSDSYFLPLCHAFAGSAVIDFPLSAYRVHGANYYVGREAVQGLKTGSAEFRAKQPNDASDNIAAVLDGIERNHWLLGNRLWDVMDRAAGFGHRSFNFYQKPEALALFKSYAVRTMNAVGKRSFVRGISERFAVRPALEIIREANSGRLPAGSYYRVLKFRFRGKLSGRRRSVRRARVL